MHRIFGLHDIVVKVFSLVEENRDLYSLARVDRRVSKAALDILWNDITLDKYLYLFRQELAPMGDAQMKSFPGVSLSLSHLDKIKTYAVRVRTLRRGLVFSLAELIAVSAIHRQDPVIFPYLHNLVWHNGHIDELPLLIIFFAPTLKLVNLRDIQPITSDNTLENSYESSMLTPLNGLLTRTIHLQKLYLPIPARSLEAQSDSSATHIPDITDDYRAACETFFDNGAGDYLVEIDIILTPGILRRVGRLSRLRYLRLYQISYQEELEDMLDEDNAKTSTVDNHDNMAPFPSLECLSLRQLKSLSRITMMLFQFSCIPRYEFHAEIELMPSEDDLSWLVHILTNSQRTLKTFGLRVGSESLSRFLPNPESSIRFRTTFRPLLRCVDMRYLFLQIPFQIEFTDSDVRNIVQSCSHLQILYLGENPADMLSIKGITDLAKCPALQYVHLSFSIRKRELSHFFGKTDISEGPAASCPSLERMHINRSTIEVGCAVGTAFLFQVCFPRAELAVIEEPSGVHDGRSSMVERWEEVKEGMKACSVSGASDSPVIYPVVCRGLCPIEDVSSRQEFGYPSSRTVTKSVTLTLASLNAFMSSVHISQLAAIPNPRLNQVVHREECTQCFDNQDLAEGIDVCLSCFNGGCVGMDETRKHAQLHSQKTGHPFSLNIRRILKPSSRRDSSGPPLKKIAIIEESEEEKYTYETTIRCWTYNGNGKLMPELSTNQEVQRLSTAVMQSMSSARKSEVKSWEEEIVACEHTLTLQQHETGPILSSGLAQCVKCDIKDNLWLCLTCGSLGCGRQQYGGIGGNGHGLQHYQESGHPISVKLGTITPEGNADIFCYTCGDSKLDHDLSHHLAMFGINIATQTKTEKSITELQIEQNLKFDFSLTGEDGKALEPVFGPGLTGLRNLGNSCYMASTLQTIFSLPSFKNQYFNAFYDHARICPEPFPANCIDCQMCKMADGLLSGRYSVARSSLSSTAATAVSEPMTVDADPLVHPSPSPVFQEGIKPIMFKDLIGRGHAEFATMRQQDAEEFLAHLLKTLRQQARRTGKNDSNATDIFKFGMQQRLECGVCHGVKYRVDEHDVLSLGVEAKEVGKDEDGKIEYATVGLLDCIANALGVEDIEYRCNRCDRDIFAKKQTLFATFPDVLVVHAKKFQLVNWVPAKLDIHVELPPKDILTLDSFLGKGAQEGEDVLLEDSGSNQPTVQDARPEPSFNEAALEQLQTMGFPLVRCQKALLATGNSDAEVAMEWLFAHMDDSDIDEPIQSQASANPASTASPEQISMLNDMGFTTAQAQKALRETGGDMERAVEWLFNHPDDSGEDNAVAAASSSLTIPTFGGSATLPAKFYLKAFISHKGPSVHSGHYVAHIRTERGWTLFNDEKVVKADDESVEQLKKLAYLYIFERAKDA
ncbi:hypothetical protein Clacol_009109 [Clathrus columnatus]|uniref:Ubiquitin carboxyl-terminal hydrolase 14 n=1 Tax=Clathrus columnatus TaxID=1419009 RepID=A0AAV5AR35_9AGAM|nr:hypothetical protein Clacol_009109 [Clathrus columnatus]